MHTVTNTSNGPHDVRTSIGIIRLERGDAVTADFERTYLALLRNGRSFNVVEAGETPQGVVRASGATEGTGEGENAAGQQENGPAGDDTPDPEPRTRADWVKLAESKSIKVKGGWSIKDIKAAIEKVS